MIIQEFLPNPVGADNAGEYIKIFNDGDKAVNLAGWKISDASNKSFSLSGTIQPGGNLSLPYSQTKISLNNNGETISLFDAKGALVDKLGYSGVATEGKLITHQKTETAEVGFTNGEVLNQRLMPSNGKMIATDLFLALILGLVAVYVILQLEKRLDIKLF
ncbi:MAG: lamin tail domain-containing protein [Patescibacteria group bacterium]|nr:lamin tail domain-containing protein [Patescibacteria group bacterium]